MKQGKKFKAAAALVDREQRYTLVEAVDLVRKTQFAKFDETLEVHVRLGVNPRAADQQVRGTVALPHGTGKEVRVVVFAQGEHAVAARDAGADVVGGSDLADRIQGGWLDFEAVVATPDMMRDVGKLGKVLGPRGLMPNPKTGTVTFNVAEAVRSLKAGQVEFRLDRNAIVHAAVGKMSFSNEQLVDNLGAYLDAVAKARPSSVKGVYMRSVTVCSTMSPGVKVTYDPVVAR
ncbi:50S ribosomal protein L1 [bacterium]|nr:50S ribosomal protein L1 [bacterium]